MVAKEQKFSIQFLSLTIIITAYAKSYNHQTNYKTNPCLFYSLLFPLGTHAIMYLYNAKDGFT